MKFFNCVVAASFFVQSARASDKIHASVHRALQTDGAVNILVSFKDGPQAALNRVEVSNEARAREDRVVAVVESLEQHAQQSQKEVLELAAKYKGSEARGGGAGSEKLLDDASSFWLTNQVWVANASAKFVQMVSALDTVTQVYKDEVVPFTEPNMEDEIKNAVIEYGNGSIFAGADDGTDSAVQWGITKVRAPELWTQGITGKGVVIGSIDTGVRSTHETLKATFRGEYGWYDAIGQHAEPYDDVGHGTHTLGTMVGQSGYGVAPGATWMSCKACSPDGCLGSALVKCAQWMTCPTTTTGTRNCTKAPHVINNSWGGGKSLSYFSDAIDGWRKAGIIPVFSNGNGGPGCGTVSSPADLTTVISVGATDRNDVLASFSSKGPAQNVIKPDISAPGALVRSALQTADSAYGLMSGTSMAAPHVAGVVALMLSQNSSLSFDDVVLLLRGNNQASGLKATGANCGGISEAAFPNNVYGAGRLDAALVFEKLVSLKPTPAPTQAPVPAPTQIPTSPPFQQRWPAQQQQQILIQPASIPRDAGSLPTDSSVLGTAVAADTAALTGDFSSTSVSF